MWSKSSIILVAWRSRNLRRVLSLPEFLVGSEVGKSSFLCCWEFSCLDNGSSSWVVIWIVTSISDSVHSFEALWWGGGGNSTVLVHCRFAVMSLSTCIRSVTMSSGIVAVFLVELESFFLFLILGCIETGHFFPWKLPPGVVAHYSEDSRIS